MSMSQKDMYVFKALEFRIAIRFGDNDFSHSGLAALRVYMDAIPWSAQHPGNCLTDLTKEQHAEILRDLMAACYRTHQTPFGYKYPGYDTAEAYHVHMTKYIHGKIRPERILLNDEVDAWILEVRKYHGDNGETFVLDMRLPSAQAVFAI